MGTPFSSEEEYVIGMLESDYEVEEQDARLAVSKAREAGVFLAREEGDSLDSLSEMIYDDQRFWSHI